MEKITCGLTADEIEQLIKWHGYSFAETQALLDDGSYKFDAAIERINYLNKRLKSKDAKPEQQQSADKEQQQAPPVTANNGWGASA